MRVRRGGSHSESVANTATCPPLATKCVRRREGGTYVPPPTSPTTKELSRDLRLVLLNSIAVFVRVKPITNKPSHNATHVEVLLFALESVARDLVEHLLDHCLLAPNVLELEREPRIGEVAAPLQLEFAMRLQRSGDNINTHKICTCIHHAANLNENISTYPANLHEDIPL